MKKTILIRTAVLIVIFALLLGITIGEGYFKYYVLKEQNFEHLDEKFKYVKSILDEYYLYADEVKAEQYEDAILKGLVFAAGDPYTRYITKSEYEKFNITMKGSYGGIGIAVSENENGIKINELMKDKPAEISGLIKGDIITHINGKKINNISFEEALGLMRGTIGTNMELTILRNGIKKPLILNIKRDEIELKHVNFKMLDNNIAYIEYLVFSESSITQFEKILDKIKEEEVKNIIIDLRNNHGGLVNSATSIAKHFIDKGDIVFYERFNNSEEKITITDKTDTYKFNKIIILINKETASAAEMLAGSLKENNKAILIGEQTYGKGITQQVFPLNEKQALSITVSEYLTPLKNKVHGIGIEPNIKIENNAEDMVKGIDKQLEKAIEVINDND